MQRFWDQLADKSQSLVPDADAPRALSGPPSFDRHPRRASLGRLGCRPPSCSDAGRSLSTPRPTPFPPLSLSFSLGLLWGSLSLHLDFLALAAYSPAQWTPWVEYWRSSSSLPCLLSGVARGSMHSTGGLVLTCVYCAHPYSFPSAQVFCLCSSFKRRSRNVTRSPLSSFLSIPQRRTLGCRRIT